MLLNSNSNNDLHIVMLIVNCYTPWIVCFIVFFRKSVCLAGNQSGWSLRKVFSVYLHPGKCCYECHVQSLFYFSFVCVFVDWQKIVDTFL